ncbi:hypothetical protein [Mesorhizobium sp.]|uniref:hypothetical protein n=1 Tax=Mesorhizobium sp. TaxID=1871066 RepID=UPI003BA9D58E
MSTHPTHSLPLRPSSSPAEAKPEAPSNACRHPQAGSARHADASGPVRPSPATGTAGAAAPLGSGPLFCRDRATWLASRIRPGRSCIRTQDGTVILFDRLSGRAVSAATVAQAEAAFRLACPDAGDAPP